jgi:hypothetical protein
MFASTSQDGPHRGLTRRRDGRRRRLDLLGRWRRNPDANKRRNNEAATRADEGALDYDTCRDPGRVWSLGTDRCLRLKRGRN